MPDPSAPPAPPAPPKRENVLASLLLNVLLPVMILSYCGGKSGWYAVGPKWALLIATSLPVGYQAYDWVQRRKLNVFSILGLVGVLLTGGLGLLELSAQAFAVKEAALPLVLAALFLWTHRAGNPLVKMLLMNPELMDVGLIERTITERQQQPALQQILGRATVTLAGSFVFSAALNYGVALYFLSGTIPGSEAYTAALGKVSGWGTVITGVPLLVFLVLAFQRLTRDLQRLTGLSDDQLTAGR